MSYFGGGGRYLLKEGISCVKAVKRDQSGWSEVKPPRNLSITFRIATRGKRNHPDRRKYTSKGSTCKPQDSKFNF